jgi:hypothetical protein
MRDHRNLRLRNVDVIEAGAFGVRLLGAVGFDLAPWIEKETGILLEKFGGIDKVIECTVPAKKLSSPVADPVRQRFDVGRDRRVVGQASAP